MDGWVSLPARPGWAAGHSTGGPRSEGIGSSRLQDLPAPPLATFQTGGMSGDHAQELRSGSRPPSEGSKAISVLSVAQYSAPTMEGLVIQVRGESGVALDAARRQRIVSPAPGTYSVAAPRAYPRHGSRQEEWRAFPQPSVWYSVASPGSTSYATRTGRTKRQTARDSTARVPVSTTRSGSSG